MRSWPLRLKIALWSALVVALALSVTALAANWHFRQEDQELLDNLLKSEARGVVRELERIPADFDFEHRAVDRYLPANFAYRRIEITREGRVIYRSKKMSPEVFGRAALAPGYYSMGSDESLRLTVVDRGPWQIRVAIDTEQTRDPAQELRRAFLLSLPGLLLVTGLGGWWIARQALSPIQAVTRAAEEITAERLNRRLPVPSGKDEVRHLSLVLNEMIERLERSFLQAQRFSADTSHELRTPLAVLRAGLEAMLFTRGITSVQEKQLLDLLDASTNLAVLSEKLLLLSKADAGFVSLHHTRFDFADVLREAVDEAAVFADSSRIQMQSEAPLHLMLFGDKSRLMQVLRNLLENAVKYNRVGGVVKVCLSATATALQVEVMNTGAGVDPNHAGKIFERFYRAEAHRSSAGHGLGLSISQEIARAHGGALKLSSSNAELTTFVLTIPTSAPSNELTDAKSSA